ncbi:MaoC family dehydratase N-terminal domain-containing protein [Erythrobacter sp. MTPC3]|uniref:FAS1-like dehydratase domain-containing protein n=1 Tax=Erythrobacter sp. MTPC3 TaxID=3056564 RepID=UPI0036F3D25F
MSAFASWIGRAQSASDTLDEARAARWLATFDLSAHMGEAMPQGIHFCLCTPDAPTAQLGKDGHPARDTSEASFLPPFPMPRRMWASSRIAFHAPIAVGAAISRLSTVASVSEKSGSSGRLAFVDIEHRTQADGALAVSEMQTLVYRDVAAADAPLVPPQPGADAFDPSRWEAHRQILPDPRLLFRFSALTFNTHRIHYDAHYAREVERYRGLVVHGPLTASLLLQLAAGELGDNALTSFAFRGLSPAICGEALHLVMRKTGEGSEFELGAFASDGRHVMSAKAAI